MDLHLRELERLARGGDVDAALRWATHLYRIATEHMLMDEEGNPIPNCHFFQFKEALALAGNQLVPLFLLRLNEALVGSPFRPIGLGPVDSPTNHYCPPYWWASLKETYGLVQETYSCGTTIIPEGEFGLVPGRTHHYGLSIQYALHPSGRRTALVSDTIKTNAVYSWLGRPKSPPNAPFPPPGWTNQVEFEQRNTNLRRQIAKAIRFADPELEVRFSTGQGFDKGQLPPA